MAEDTPPTWKYRRRSGSGSSPTADDLLVISDPRSRKVHNIERQPTVTVHFNSDLAGGDVVVIAGGPRSPTARRLVANALA